MHRRRFLSTIGVLGMAGCTGSESSSSTPTRTPTATKNPTATAGPPAPSIQQTELLSHHDEFGDVLTNEMESVGAGGRAIIGTRYSIAVHDGKSEEFVQMTIYGEDSSIDSNSISDTSLADANVESEDYEMWMAFETEGWEKKTYTAEVIVRDEISGKNSDTSKLEFDVVQPLGSGEVTLESVEKPPAIKKGEPFRMKLNLRNTSNRDSSIVSTISSRYENSEWQSSGASSKIRFNIPAQTTRTWETAEVSYDYAGDYEARLDAVDVSWSFTVSE